MDNVEKKFVKFDEVVKLVQQAVKEPEHSGEIKDYMELCKLYDKNDNGTVMLAELENFLSNLGDMVPILTSCVVKLQLTPRPHKKIK